VRRQLLLTYLALAVAVLAALEIPLGITYGRSQRNDLESRIKVDALTLATLAEDNLEHSVTAPSAAGPRTTSVAPRAGGVSVPRTVVVATAPPTSAGSSPRSASDRVTISLDRAAMMPFNEGYRGSPSA